MKFKLDSPSFISREQIGFEKSVVFLGSCFSDEISSKFRNAGFDVLSNPFGTIFHPEALRRLIDPRNVNTTFSLFQSGNSFYSWDCATVITDKNKEKLEEKINQESHNLQTYLGKASHLFITFGSAWGYRLASENYLVANCHKQTASLFTKELTNLQEMISSWREIIQNLNSRFLRLSIVFTVSPVRHIKDGLAENNRSKARLIELTHTLKDDFDFVEYFPSYEIVVDELRDYRFYKQDLVHPNEQASTYIWEQICASFFDKRTNMIVSEVEKVRHFLEHRPITTDPEMLDKLIEKQAEQKALLLQRYPFLHL